MFALDGGDGLVVAVMRSSKAGHQVGGKGNQQQIDAVHQRQKSGHAWVIS